MLEIARRQHGVVTLAQLRACGFTADAVRGLARRREVGRLHRGVYLLGPMPGPATREVAAVLACGIGAVASHRSAAYLHAVLPRLAQPGPVHVTVAGRHLDGDRGIVVHETASLLPHEIRERDGIAVTAPIRTILDLAGCCDAGELESAVAEAFALRLVNRATLLRAADAAAGRRGVARLAGLLEGRRSPARTRSRPERELLAAIRAAGLPEPETNAKLGRWEVDFLWRDARLVVEVDAYSTHSSPRAFERDRRKDAELFALEFTVLRVTADRVRAEAGAVVAWIRDALGRLARDRSGRRAAL